MSPHLNLKHLISSVVSIAKLLSPSVALSSELVFKIFTIQDFRGFITLLSLGGITKTNSIP